MESRGEREGAGADQWGLWRGAEQATWERLSSPRGEREPDPSLRGIHSCHMQIPASPAPASKLRSVSFLLTSMMYAKRSHGHALSFDTDSRMGVLSCIPLCHLKLTGESFLFNKYGTLFFFLSLF